MKIEELQEIYDNLTYFDKDLMPVESEWNKARDNDELKQQLLVDALFVNRLNTIAKNHDWILQHQGSLFKQKLFKKVIIDPTTVTDEFYGVQGYGTKMTEEEWDAYEEFHNKLFIMNLHYN